jgi:hypothetical protein
MSEQQSSAVSEQPVAYRFNTHSDQRWRVVIDKPVPKAGVTAFDKIEALYLQPTRTEPQAASSPAEIAQHETLTSRLRGRARYLRNIGEVKSPELMEQAAVALSRLKCQAGTATALDTATVEACAKFIEQHQETIREAATGTERYLAPRKVGNLMGVAYVDGLRALTRLQCQAESAK